MLIQEFLYFYIIFILIYYFSGGLERKWDDIQDGLVSHPGFQKHVKQFLGVHGLTADEPRYSSSNGKKL